MAPPGRAEPLVGIPEVIDGSVPIPDQGHTLGAEPALAARIATMPRFPRMGPPDILYMRKQYTPVVGPPKTYGYYHFVRGVDVSSPASVSTYIVDIAVNKGLDPAPWLNAGTWRIIGATYSTFNALSRADVNVHVKFPGGNSANAVNADGEALTLTDEFWRETLVSAVVRDLTSVGEHPLYPCLRILPSLPTIQAENSFLSAAASCVHRWHAAGCEEPGIETDIAANSRVAIAIHTYFISLSRYNRAIEFFDQEHLRLHDPQCAAHAATAARLMGDLDLADSILDRIITLNPNAGLAWIERSHVHAARGDLQAALQAAKTATSVFPHDLNAWLALADLYVDLHMYANALVALNRGDMPPPVLDPYLRKLVPNRKNLTTPAPGNSKGTDATRAMAQRMREERNASSARADGTLAELPGKLMTESEHDCYAVLVKILNDVGWDRMLAIRGQCFIMETDVSNASVVLPKESEDDSEESEEEAREATEEAGVDLSDMANGPVEEGVRIPGDEAAGEEDLQIESNPPDPITQELKDSGATTTVDGVKDNLGVMSLISISEEEGVQNGTVHEAAVDGLSAANEAGENGTDEESESDTEAESEEDRVEEADKTVCKPWLDYLVTNIYEDLRAMAVWSAEELQHIAAAEALQSARSSRSPGSTVSRGSSSAGHDVEAGEPALIHDRSADEVAATTKRPPVDWLRRGELALRLRKVEEAKTAFWTCIKLSEKAKIHAISALCSLMSLSAREGDVKTTLQCADGIWNYTDLATDRKATSESVPAVAPIKRSIFKLIGKRGLQKVREVIESKIDIDKKRMEGILLDAVAWQVHGFAN